MGESEIVEEVRAVKAVLEDRLAYDETKEKAFNRLYEELDALKRSSIDECKRALLIDLILLYDRVIFHVGQSGGNFIESIAFEIEEILLRRGVERVDRERISESARFDKKTQKVFSTRPTSVKDEDGVVDAVVRDGFVLGELLLRPQAVVVRKFVGGAGSR